MKVAKNKYNVEFILTAYNEDNEREVEQMVSKAMCAYANWQERKSNKAELAEEFGKAQVELAITASESEYEATVSCIGLFVEQPTSVICNYVIARCYEEFGI